MIFHAWLFDGVFGSGCNKLQQKVLGNSTRGAFTLELGCKRTQHAETDDILRNFEANTSGQVQIACEKQRPVAWKL